MAFIDTILGMNLHFLLLMCIGLVSVSNATSFYIRPFRDFAQEASLIVRGRVHTVRTENGTAPTGGQTIYTYANLDVKDVIKGKVKQNEILIRRLGGTKDGLGLEIPGSPHFVENEEAVLFLGKENEDQSYEVTGMELGKFGLTEKDGEIVLTGGLFAYSRPRPDQDGEGMGPGIVENLKPWPLRNLKALFQNQLLTERSPLPPPAPPAKQEEKNRVPVSGSPMTPSLTPPEREASSPPLPSPSDAPSHPSPFDAPSHPPVNFAWVWMGIGTGFFVLFLLLRRK